ncbi:MAG: xanthine dehydrogenase family protein subunit M [Candidatus Tectomicrobia bacterium]|nr:xanthine dehydrogenase family protein subunit M [Candidatus Tectomicrobia bacterium]
MRDFELLYPATIAEACQALRRHGEGARLLAGGTSLVQFLKEGMYVPEVLVALQRIPALDAVVAADGGLRIGAMARLTDLERHAALRQAAPLLRAALHLVGNVRVRNVATLGGNLCHADPHADPPTALVALRAEVVLGDGAQSRQLPVAEFLLDYYETALRPGELLQGIIVPRQERGQVSVYRRFTAVSEEDWPCVTLAAVGSVRGRAPNLACAALRLVVGALEPRPRLIAGIDELLPLEAGDAARRETLAETVMAQLAPVDDLLGSAWYKRQIAGVLAREALADLFQQGAAP